MKLDTRHFSPALAVLALAFGLAATAAQATVATLRVMLHPYLAAPGTFPPAAQAKLDALAGLPLTAIDFTRNGAVDLALPVPMDDIAAAAMLTRLRSDRSILWAVIPAAAAAPAASKSVRKSAQATTQPPEMGTRFMLRLAAGVDPDWAILLPQMQAAIGVPIVPLSQIADVWVMGLLQAQTQATLSAMAGALQNVPGVQYVDPVHRVTAMLTPNDPLFAQQWGLSDPISGINAPTAWGITVGASSITVAVTDTGITVHPDLSGRILPGYNFISDPAAARNNVGRSPDPSDMGDWSAAGACYPGSPASDSSWHGTFVTGLIAADSNNGVGIAGVNWAAQILPVRVLGMCGGTNEDVFAGVMWAAGVPIDGVPPNPNPARVINMSLGGEGACDGATQEAIDTALAQGVVIVVAAGNSSEDAANFTPANCSGVIAVAAAGITGNLASYSNFGSTVDLTAPGGDIDDGTAGLIISTWNDGLTVPGNPVYGIGAGTSFAAPHVTGTVSLMLARNANLTSGQVQSILQGTARTFPAGTICASSGLCGSGLLDAGAAVGSTVPSDGVVPPGAVAVIEYYRSDLDHYFITSSPSEITYYDTVMAGIFLRTGGVFFAYPSQASAPVGAQPVCRYSAAGLINSNFWSANATECATVGSDTADGWTLNTPAAFWIALADSNGACAAGNVPVYNFFNNRRDANQRITVDLSVRRAMLNRAWVLDAPTPNGAVYCSPVS